MSKSKKKGFPYKAREGQSQRGRGHRGQVLRSAGRRPSLPDGTHMLGRELRPVLQRGRQSGALSAAPRNAHMGQTLSTSLCHVT